jgi:hypothetical protein
VAFIRDSVVRGGTFTRFRVEENKEYFVNVGSVGQPRDNDPRVDTTVRRTTAEVGS